MSENQQRITITKQEEIIGNIIMMFSILSNEASNKKIIQEGDKIYIEKKESTQLQIDTTELKNRIFDWIDDRNNYKPLYLTQTESDLLRQCSHAAYYMVTERNEEELIELDKKFIFFHENFFKQ
jgi:hypothetical protein